MCNPDEFLRQPKIAYKENGALNKIALNGLIINSMGLDTNYDKAHIFLVHWAYFGEWKEWSELKKYYFVFGAKTRYQEH